MSVGGRATGPLAVRRENTIPDTRWDPIVRRFSDHPVAALPTVSRLPGVEMALMDDDVPFPSDHVRYQHMRTERMAEPIYRGRWSPAYRR